MVYSRFITGLFLLILLIGCSSKSSAPINPQMEADPQLTQSDIEFDRHNLLGIWQLRFDSNTREFAVVPDRSLLAHYNVTGLIPLPVVQINEIHPNGVIDIDVTLSNPYSIDAYDVRLIIFTNDSLDGLLNPDDWTPLYDIPGGMDINPFVAYAKSEPLRKFARNTEHTEDLQIYLEPGHTWLHFAVDASYPSNCEEPYTIDNFTQETLEDWMGGSALVEVDVYDWQDNVSNVYLECPIITGQPSVSFYSISSTTWRLNLINETAAPHGEYIGYIKAQSLNSGSLALYDRVIITVTYTGVPDTDPPRWDSTVGIQSATPGFNSVTVTWGSATDLRSPPVSYLVYKDEDNFPWDQPPVVKSNYTHTFFNLSGGVTYWFGVRCQDSASPPNVDDNTVVISAVPVEMQGGGVLTWSGQQKSAYGNSVECDSSGNIYCLCLLNLDKQILIKLNPDYQLIWSTPICGPSSGYISARDLAISNSGFVYIVGSFFETIDFDPGPGQFLRTSRYCGRYETYYTIDIYVSKFDTNGNYIWTKDFGNYCYGSSNEGCDQGNAICVDNTGDPYITGSMGDWDSNDTRLMIAKMSQIQGNFIWMHSIPSDNGFANYGNGIVHDGNGKVSVTGRFFGTMDFDPGPDEDFHTAFGTADIFLTQFDSNGQFQWAQTWGSSGSDDLCQSLTVDDLMNIYVFGESSGDIDLNPGPPIEILYGGGFFLSKFTNSGEYLWGKGWGGKWYWSIDSYGVSFCSDKIYLMGRYSGTDIDFDPGPGTDLHSTYGYDRDLFASKFDTDGNFIWARTWYGPETKEYPGFMDCDPSCNLFIVGSFKGSLDFDPGPDTCVKTTDEWDDAFLLKLLPNGYWE